MSRNKIYIYSVLVLLLFLSWIFSPSNKKNEDFSERVKVSLRDVGNQLLLSNKDATSLVFPVTKFDDFTYKISFQNQLSFEPSNLVAIVDSSFKKAALSNYYRVEVLQCSDNEVAYSFEIKNQIEKDIVPCKGRILPKSCYIIKLKFTNRTIVPFNKSLFLIVFVLLLVVFLFDYKFSKKKIKELPTDDKNKATKIGIFQFYPEQNKLVKQAKEINLSKKECELLAIFVANPNQIIKRDELTKKVWEDNGVFVGRSLDTYISKLRQKLQEDSSIKISNKYGVGYKLEIS